MTRPLRVFLCHASQDKPAVRRLHRYLKQHGIEPWLDELDLLPGENWEVEIPRALYASDVILVCLSRNSVNKEGYVQKEISFALDKALEKPDGTIFIIPAKLEDCEVPKRLNRYQWVDLFRTDSNKRLLLGLNKRALGLGSDVFPVILEDTRQRKPVVKPIDQDALEKAKWAAQEKEERESAERIQRVKDELEAQEKIKREISENAAREKLKLETAEKTERETAKRTARAKEEREEADRIARENLNNVISKEIIQENVQREAEEKFAREKAVRNAANSRWLGIGGIILIVFVFGGFGLNYLINNLTVATATPVISPLATLKPVTPTKTKVSQISTPEPPTFTPTPQAGSTMISIQDDMVMVYVPEGEFTMGDDSSDAPIHTVYLDAFWIDQTEVTNKQYKACVDAGICEPPSSSSSYTYSNYYGNPKFDNYPVIYVNWDKANRYCEVWKEGDGDLPTEAQWEKAARGTDGRIYPWGNDEPNSILLNYNQNIGDTTMVKNYPNTDSFYGTYDMAGNVWEWVNDWYQSDYYVTLGDNVSNPQGPASGDGRMLRGGSWYVSDDSVRSALRDGYVPTGRVVSIGFRCARSP